MTRKKKVLFPIIVFFLAVTIIITGCDQAGGGQQTTATTSPPASETGTGNTATTSTMTTTQTSISPTQSSVQMIRDITVTEAYELIQKNKNNPDFIIIDIRTPEEYESRHLENAILTDYYAESFKEEIGKLDRTKKYLVYCGSARRSGLAMEIFKELGFKDVLNMTGGITEWISQGYPIVK